MTDPSLGLVDQLINVIKEDTSDARIKALSSVSNFLASGEIQVITALADPALGLLIQYVEILKLDKSEARILVFGGINNLALVEECRKLMVSPDLGLLE